MKMFLAAFLAVAFLASSPVVRAADKPPAGDKGDKAGGDKKKDEKKDEKKDDKKAGGGGGW